MVLVVEGRAPTVGLWSGRPLHPSLARPLHSNRARYDFRIVKVSTIPSTTKTICRLRLISIKGVMLRPYNNHGCGNQCLYHSTVPLLTLTPSSNSQSSRPCLIGGQTLMTHNHRSELLARNHTWPCEPGESTNSRTALEKASHVINFCHFLEMEYSKTVSAVGCYSIIPREVPGQKEESGAAQTALSSAHWYRTRGHYRFHCPRRFSSGPRGTNRDSGLIRTSGACKGAEIELEAVANEEHFLKCVEVLGRLSQVLAGTSRTHSMGGGLESGARAGVLILGLDLGVGRTWGTSIGIP